MRVDNAMPKKLVTKTDVRLDRTSRIAVVSIWIIVGGAVLANVMTIIAVVSGRYLFTSGGAEPQLQLSYLPKLAQADLRERNTGFLTDAAIWIRLLSASQLVLNALTIALAAVTFVRIMQDIAAGRPFASSVLSNWAKLSVVLIVGGWCRDWLTPSPVLPSSGLPPRASLPMTTHWELTTALSAPPCVNGRSSCFY
jgi:hypothetical protein